MMIKRLGLKGDCRRDFGDGMDLLSASVATSYKQYSLRRVKREKVQVIFNIRN